MRRNNIPIFIGKMLLMILLNSFSGFILVTINMGLIFLIIFLAYFVYNLYALLICYTKEAVIKLKNIDKVLLIIFTIIFIISFTFVLIFIDSIRADRHGAIFMFPLIALGLSAVSFFTAYAIDRAVNKKISGE